RGRCDRAPVDVGVAQAVRGVALVDLLGASVALLGPNRPFKSRPPAVLPASAGLPAAVLVVSDWGGGAKTEMRLIIVAVRNDPPRRPFLVEQGVRRHFRRAPADRRGPTRADLLAEGGGWGGDRQIGGGYLSTTSSASTVNATKNGDVAAISIACRETWWASGR